MAMTAPMATTIRIQVGPGGRVSPRLGCRTSQGEAHALERRDDRRGGDRDHGTGEETEKNAVGEIVEDDGLAAGDLLQLIVKRQSRL